MSRNPTQDDIRAAITELELAIAKYNADTGRDRLRRSGDTDPESGDWDVGGIIDAVLAHTRLVIYPDDDDDCGPGFNTVLFHAGEGGDCGIPDDREYGSLLDTLIPTTGHYWTDEQGRTERCRYVIRKVESLARRLAQVIG